MTLSPGLTLVTPAPSSLTTPASSLPGENGSGGLNWYLFWMMSTSGKLTLAALTATTTSPGPALGEGNSSNVSDSGGPYCLQRTAFIAIECHMPKLTTDDGVQLYYEEAGAGTPVVFVHEFGGDHRSWEPQVRYFSRRYRCIAYNARGYPPSDVPEDFERYSQARARDDIRAVLDALRIDKAHVVGLSMGAFATLHFGMAYGKRALSITVAGGGYGSHPAQYRQFQADSKKNADAIRSQGMKHFVATYGHGPQRVQLEIKDPRGFAEYLRQFEEHSPLGAANTLLGVQSRRPSFYDLTAEMARMEVPALIMSGDEEEPCLEVKLLMKRTIPGAALAILPRSGHAINLEEPALFNQLLESLFHQVEAGRWSPRDPRSTVPSIYGPSGKP
jgi:pimeloyl-ACP methyl ester carboxylesterase